jgi:hypothetical protein
MARQVFAQTRSIESDPEGRRVVMLTFPAGAFEGVVHLDPREAIEVRLGRSGTDQSVSVYFEVGDLAAAQAFLAARPPPPSPPATRPTS